MAQQATGTLVGVMKWLFRLFCFVVFFLFCGDYSNLSTQTFLPLHLLFVKIKLGFLFLWYIHEAFFPSLKPNLTCTICTQILFRKDCPFFSTADVGLVLYLSCPTLEALASLSSSAADFISCLLHEASVSNWNEFILLLGFTLFLVLAIWTVSSVFSFQELLGG